MKENEIFSKTQSSLSMNWKWSDHHICSVYYICSSRRGVGDIEVASVINFSEASGRVAAGLCMTEG